MDPSAAQCVWIVDFVLITCVRKAQLLQIEMGHEKRNECVDLGFGLCKMFSHRSVDHFWKGCSNYN